MKEIILLLITLLLISCDKYVCVKKSSPKMVGDWVHLSDNNGFHYIYIQENGRGNMHGENEHGNNQDTQGRGWYIKEDVLYFSRFYNKAEEDKFDINLYPTVATQEINTPYDTVKIGMTYMKLNNRIYIKLK